MRHHLENQKFGRLTVVRREVTRRTTGGNPVGQWLCLCDCGKEKIISTLSLTQGKVKSCGCYRTELSPTHGFKNTHGGFSKQATAKDRIKYQALSNIKERARRRGYESDLAFEDLPELFDSCPILGIPYQKGSLKNKDASPSIDRKNPNLPYLKKYKGNLVFISHRANRLKADATVEELEKVIKYMGSL
jgi:hypothetical protein